MKNQPNWVIWNSPSKIPYNPKSIRTGAKANDSSTWGTYEEAVAAAEKNGFSGIGFEFGGTDFVGIDFDNLVDNGEADPYVIEILEKLGNPYCEVSPSGTGLHAFVLCERVPGEKRKFSNGEHYGAEIYSGREKGRYFTITGQKFSGNGVPRIDDISIPYLLLSQIHDTKFKSLWLGDCSEYGHDQSRADLALAWMLAQLLDRNPALVERAFSASKPGQREKWRDRQDYRDRTLTKACASKKGPTEAEINQSVAISDCEPEPEIIDEPLPEFPTLGGSIAEFADALCPDVPREFKIMSAVTRVGLAISGKVQLEAELHLQPRFYTCFIAEPGRGKTAAIKETRVINSGYREVPSIDSAPALVDAFAETEDGPRRPATQSRRSG